MKYLTTRGGSQGASFEEAVLEGLGKDGGLYIPESIPALPDDWQKWASLGFAELAVEILSLFIDQQEITREDLLTLTTKSYASFRDKEITPVKLIRRRDHLMILELFHGPTFAFKDIALQFVGNLFEYFLSRKNKGKIGGERHRVTVVGATSGDTGSAAIYGLRNKQDLSVFILYPNGRVSPIQEAQMTTVLDPNVHNLSVGGTFDDCQDIVKTLFADRDFNLKYHLGAVNSINWARILAQVVYYFAAYFKVRKAYGQDVKLQYVVPTGNFGDILAGYFAMRMGLPMEPLVVATNENDILDRFWKTGRYEKKSTPPGQGENGIPEDGSKAHEEGAKETLSPAMDILVSSNFERLLWYLAYECEAEGCAQKAGNILKGWMADVKTTGRLVVPPNVLNIARRDFQSRRVSDEETLETIKRFYLKEPDMEASYMLDPHSAVGVAAAEYILRQRQSKDQSLFTVCLATAHPAKFSHAVDLALHGVEGYSFDQVLPVEFRDLLQKEKRVIHIPSASVSLVKDAIVQSLQQEGKL